MTRKILLYILLGYTLISAAGFTQTKNNLQVAGTPTYDEREYKFSFAIKNNIDPKKLAGSINKRLQALIDSKTLKAPVLLAKPFYLDKSFKPFLFKDIYCDTPDLFLANNSAEYRQRYRFEPANRYWQYKRNPKDKKAYPIRCEVDFKKKIDHNLKTGLFLSQETRFEYRNQSEPFIVNNDAPPAPWPEKEYLAYTCQGSYQNYRMRSYQMLTDFCAEKKYKLQRLQPVITAETTRTRSHFSITNPWGFGPNPEQSIIITIDQSLSRPYAAPKSKPAQILDIEIEMDRNLLKNLDKCAQGVIPEDIYKYPFWEGKSKKEIQKFSAAALEVFKHDHALIRDAIEEVIKKYPELNKTQTLPGVKYIRHAKNFSLLRP